MAVLSGWVAQGLQKEHGGTGASVRKYLPLNTGVAWSGSLRVGAGPVSTSRGHGQSMADKAKRATYSKYRVLPEAGRHRRAGYFGGQRYLGRYLGDCNE